MQLFFNKRPSDYGGDNSKERLLFHGTKSSPDVFGDQVRLDMSRGFMDFGPGFYLTDSFDHAVKRAKPDPASFIPGYVYVFLVPKRFPGNVKGFTTSSVDWLDLVVNCRYSLSKWHPYDVVIGPTADADAAADIDDFVKDNGLDANKWDPGVAQKFAASLKTHVFGKQTCISSQLAVDVIRRVDLIVV